ncbi:MAG TPA: hypothetical protein P5048_03345 [Chlamydiales bacterium]|nr:hypothetical protein [Chlamydiales bacterium]
MDVSSDPCVRVVGRYSVPLEEQTPVGGQVDKEDLRNLFDELSGCRPIDFSESVDLAFERVSFKRRSQQHSTACKVSAVVTQDSEKGIWFIPPPKFYSVEDDEDVLAGKDPSCDDQGSWPEEVLFGEEESNLSNYLKKPTVFFSGRYS